jgi:hypothetical protein
MIIMSETLQARREERRLARQRKRELPGNIWAAILCTVFALVVTAPWLMLATQVTTQGSW